MGFPGPLCRRSTKILGMMLLSLPYTLYYFIVKAILFLSPPRRKTTKIFCRNDCVWLAAGSVDPTHWVRAVFVLDGTVRLDEVQTRVNERLIAKHPKLRRRVGKFAGFDVWEDAENFDVARHVSYLTDDAGENVITYADKDELVDAVNVAGKKPHDPRQPLWRLFVVPKTDATGAALIFSFSHAIMDGNSLWLNVYPALSDSAVDPPDVGKSLGFRRRLKLCRAAVGETKKSLKQQFGQPDMNPLRDTGAETGLRDVYYPEMFDFKEFRAVTKKFGCSVNDVFTSCFTGAILRYCDDIAALKGLKADWSNWRLSSTVPVSYWAKGEKPKMKNNVAITRVILPTDQVTPEERLKATKEACDRYIKTSAHPWTLYMLSNATPVPHWLTFKGVDMMEPTVTLSCTNVKGPSQKLVFFGRQVEDILFFSTLAPDRTPDCLICMMSYDGKVGVQITIRNPILPAGDDGRVVQRYFREELAALSRADNFDLPKSVVEVPVEEKVDSPAIMVESAESVIADSSSSSAASTSGVESDSNPECEEDEEVDSLDLDVEDIEMELRCYSGSDLTDEEGTLHKRKKQSSISDIHVTIDGEDADVEDSADDDGLLVSRGNDDKSSTFVMRFENECRALTAAEVHEITKL